MRILVVRFSAIGDCVMAVPVAASVRRATPAAFIGWAVETRCAPVVDVESLVDARSDCPRDVWQRRAWSPGVWREQLRYFVGLRKLRFELGLDLQGHSKTAICLRLSGAPRRIAAGATDMLAKRLNPQLTPLGIVEHRVERNLRTLESLTGIRGEPLFAMPELKSETGRIRSSTHGRLATIAVGAGRPQKAYAKENWALVAQELLSSGWNVAFLGGPSETAPETPGAVDMVGRLSLRESMAWVAASDLHLAGDTGTGHLAAAYGVPVVSVFGPTDPAEFRPYSTLARVLQRSDDPNGVAPGQLLEAALSLTEKHERAVSH